MDQVKSQELRPITKYDLAFLSTLQKEMNTQPTLATADPRFWVIMDYQYREASVIDDISRICIINDTGSLIEQHTVQSILAAAYEDALNLGGEDYAAAWLDNTDLKRVEDADGSWIFKGLYDYCGCMDQAIKDASEYYASSRGYSYVCETKYATIAEDTLFITKSDAEAHLIANHYHYDKDAHTFAMTAWRSPELSQLYKILHEVDFRGLSELAAGDALSCRIAEELRKTANDSLGSESLQKALARITYAHDGSWRGVLRRIADLIDPASEERR